MCSAAIPDIFDNYADAVLQSRRLLRRVSAMSRSDYGDDIDNQWQLIMWRGAVNSAVTGKRGQAFLIEMRDALAPWVR